MEKKGDASMSKWNIDAMPDYRNSHIPRNQKQASGIGHDGHPLPEDCIELDDPPVQLPDRLSESGEDESDNPLTSTQSEKDPEQHGTRLSQSHTETRRMLIGSCGCRFIVERAADISAAHVRRLSRRERACAGGWVDGQGVDAPHGSRAACVSIQGSVPLGSQAVQVSPPEVSTPHEYSAG